MWKSNTTFGKIDARLQTSEMISEKWDSVISQPKYIHAYEKLYDDLWNNGANAN